MTATAEWVTIAPSNITGFTPEGGTPGLVSGAAHAHATANRPEPPFWSPDSPLFWFGVVAAVTIGAFALSVNVKAGPAKAAVSL